MTQPESVTQYSAAIRGSEAYFFEVLFQATNLAADSPLEFQATYNLNSIKNKIVRQRDRAVLLTVSISDYLIKHFNTFTEADREVLAINSPQLTKGETRYLTLIPNNEGIGLFGSNAVVLTADELPSIINLNFGFINPIDPDDKQIYDPNTPRQINANLTLPSQQIQYAVVRFRIQAQFL